ncbi:MAG: hypothetical protein L6406_14580, partial [Desulfobacterales bacterium]|nr:hypothetical protein [Desulfobacterales bacterium]
SLLDIVFSEPLRSFSLEMLPWSLSFMIFSAIIGLFYAKQRIGKEEIRRSFQAQIMTFGHL